MDFERLAILAIALAAGAFVKGATGMGLPLIALPVLTSAFGLQHAIGTMAVVQIVTNCAQTWQYREGAKDVRLNFMPVFLLTCAIGVVFGTWLLGALPERYLVVGLGIVLLVYFILKVRNPHFAIAPALAKKLSPFTGVGTGVLQGATGISAPVGVTFIHAMGLDRQSHVFAVSAMFLLLGIVHLPSLFIAGIMHRDWALEAIIALVPVLIFMPLGQRVAGKLSRKAFDRLILIFLGLMGLKMVIGL
jgi:uncharacterized membrane protein YfcA